MRPKNNALFLIGGYYRAAHNRSGYSISGRYYLKH